MTTTHRELEIGQRVRGEIVRVIDTVAKPYGFAQVPGCARDMFVPQSNVVNGAFINVGDVVEFDVRCDGGGRLYADAIDVLDAPEAA